MRKQVIILTSALSRWCQVKSDLIYAFEQALQANLSDDLKQAITAMLNRVRGGMSLEQALNKFGNFSQQEQFVDLVAAVKVNARHRGDLPSLMEMLELQFFKLEEAYQQRRISSRTELRSTIICFAASALVFTIRFSSNAAVRSHFLSTEIGNLLLWVSLFSFVTGLIFLLITIRRVNE